MLVTTVFVQIPAKGWNGADLDRMLLAATLLFILAGPGAWAVQGSNPTNTDVAKSRSPER